MSIAAPRVHPAHSVAFSDPALSVVGAMSCFDLFEIGCATLGYGMAQQEYTSPETSSAPTGQKEGGEPPRAVPLLSRQGSLCVSAASVERGKGELGGEGVWGGGRKAQGPCTSSNLSQPRPNIRFASAR